MSSGNDFSKWSCLTTSRGDIRSHRGPRLSSGLEDMEWQTLRRKKRRFYARLVTVRRLFHIRTIVLCVHFIPYYCNVVDNKYFFEISSLSRCSEVPDICSK